MLIRCAFATDLEEDNQEFLDAREDPGSPAASKRSASVSSSTRSELFEDAEGPSELAQVRAPLESTAQLEMASTRAVKAPLITLQHNLPRPGNTMTVRLAFPVW